MRVLALGFAAKSAALVSPSAPSPGPGGNAGGSEGLDGQAVALVCGALAKRRGFGGRVGGDGAAAGAGGLALRGAGRTQDGAQHGAQVEEEHVSGRGYGVDVQQQNEDGTQPAIPVHRP